MVHMYITILLLYDNFLENEVQLQLGHMNM